MTPPTELEKSMNLHIDSSLESVASIASAAMHEGFNGPLCAEFRKVLNPFRVLSIIRDLQQLQREKQAFSDSGEPTELERLRAELSRALAENKRLEEHADVAIVDGRRYGEKWVRSQLATRKLRQERAEAWKAAAEALELAYLGEPSPGELPLIDAARQLEEPSE